jgi:hypothetical protein
MEAALAQRVAAGADAASVANDCCVVWQLIAAALTPIIGAHGVAALIKRSLHLSRAAHPALSTVEIGPSADFSGLREALSNHSSAVAAAANAALLNTFHGLLCSLIGDALTERLLRSALDPHHTDRAAQDPTT